MPELYAVGDTLTDSDLSSMAADVARRAADSVRGKLGTASQVRTKATPTDAVTTADLEEFLRRRRRSP